MKKVILATTNQGKIKEFQSLLQPLNIQIISVNELDHSLVPEVIEDGLSFEENAIKKAVAFSKCFGLPALADDSGLEVDYLNGEPGIYSARYAGEGKSDQENNRKLLNTLAGVPHENRVAQFVCVIAYVEGSGKPLLARGECKGYIAERPEGQGGFGYDPIFYLPSLDKTMGELSKLEKNKISHRFNALKKLVVSLESKETSKEDGQKVRE